MAGKLASTLYTRLALGLFLLLVAVGIIYSLISIYSLRQYNASVNQQLNRDLAKDLVADRNLVDEGRLDQAALKELFELYMTINPSIEIYLLDMDGTILSYSADPEKIKRKRVSLGPIRKLLADMDEYPVLGDDPRSHDRRKVFSVTPVPSAENPAGYLYVVLRGEEYDLAETMARSSHLIEMSTWSLVTSLVVGMITGLAVFRLLTRRLTRLTHQVEAFENSGMTQPPRRFEPIQPKVAGDEIDYLAVRFDQMAGRIASQIEQLQDKDAQRRQLVAQVSHDLRTPLASMQGYIEALRMKRDRLNATEQDAFLDIALREGRRLGRLVDELFELAALDAREKVPQAESFVLAELVHDVAQKHTPEADRKQVVLNVRDNASHPMVFADLAMTERVLDNLISNAIAYSPDNSQVELVIAGDDQSLEVSVHDAGPGIPEEDLAHIFEPFYQSSHTETRAQAPGHVGLGLAIAQRMMTLQNGSIRVANGKPHGAVFTICLPADSPG